jgi:hypothetical protein
LKKYIFASILYFTTQIYCVLGQQNKVLLQLKMDSTFVENIQVIAPYFSCLQNTKIKIQFAKQKIPFTATPSALNFFKQRKNWRYVIHVSNGDTSLLSSIFYRNLSSITQSGVLAHELSHVVDFETHNRLYLVKVLFTHLSPHLLDAFETNTDKIAIQQGACRYLLAWKEAVSSQLDESIFNRKRKKQTARKRYLTAKEVLQYSKNICGQFYNTLNPMPTCMY